MKCKKCGNEIESNVCNECASSINNDIPIEENFNTVKLVLELLEKDGNMGKAFLIGLTVIIVVSIVVSVLYNYHYYSLPIFFKYL